MLPLATRWAARPLKLGPLAPNLLAPLLTSGLMGTETWTPALRIARIMFKSRRPFAAPWPSANGFDIQASKIGPGLKCRLMLRNLHFDSIDQLWAWIEKEILQGVKEWDVYLALTQYRMVSILKVGKGELQFRQDHLEQALDERVSLPCKMPESYRLLWGCNDQ